MKIMTIHSLMTMMIKITIIEILTYNLFPIHKINIQQLNLEILVKLKFNKLKQ